MNTERIDTLARVLNALTAYKAASPLGSNAATQYRLITNLTLQLIGESLTESQEFAGSASGGSWQGLLMLFIQPHQDSWKWAITESGIVTETGKCDGISEILKISRFRKIADVFIDEGFRTHEVRQFAAEYGWHCVKGRTMRNRDGLAEMLDWACRHDFQATNGFRPKPQTE